MNKQKILDEVKQNFMLKRIKAQEKADEFISKMREDSEFDRLYSNYTSKQLAYMRADYETENLMLKHDIEDLKLKLENYLKDHNIDKSNLYPKYECPICNDTGVVGGRMCKCLKTALSTRKTQALTNNISFKSFADLDKNIMSEEDKKVEEILSTWCKKFPNVTKLNINIMGKPGSGKTTFTDCIANEMIKKGYSVAYKTAFEFNELARMYHIGRAYDFSNLLDADILIIDDLGSEIVLKNVTKEYLYNLINTRQINNKPTIISTNLNLDNILEKYDERIFSRLANKNLSLNIVLNSKDKRIQ